jgi:thiamine biosynthesis protein ThiS
VKVRLNGAAREVRDAITLATLVEELDLRPDVIAVELNRAVVKRGTYSEKRLAPGDEIEIVTLVGGG